MSTKKQYRVTFDNPTAFSNKRASTMWYNTIEECSKWLEKPGAELVEREVIVNNNSLRDAMKAKFN